MQRRTSSKLMKRRFMVVIASIATSIIVMSVGVWAATSLNSIQVQNSIAFYLGHIEGTLSCYTLGAKNNVGTATAVDSATALVEIYNSAGIVENETDPTVITNGYYAATGINVNGLAAINNLGGFEKYQTIGDTANGVAIGDKIQMVFKFVKNANCDHDTQFEIVIPSDDNNEFDVTGPKYSDIFTVTYKYYIGETITGEGTPLEVSEDLKTRQCTIATHTQSISTFYVVVELEYTNQNNLNSVNASDAQWSMDFSLNVV